MSKPIDVLALLRRGGRMTAAECEQLAQEMTEAKISDFSAGIFGRSHDQPIKVLPLSDQPHHMVSGYFTQEKYICGKTPEEMGRILGAFGKFSSGALIMEFVTTLNKRDFQNRAYTYLPSGKPYEQNPNEAVYLPGHGAPQWELTRHVEARCIAELRPGEAYYRKSFRRIY